MKLHIETVKEVISVEQVINEKEVEYRTTISSSGRAKEIGIQEIGKTAQEVLLVVALNSQNEINAIQRVFIGSINQSVAHPREIFRTAFLNNAARIMIYHSHPSLNVEPSQADIDFTNRIVEAGETLGIDVLDHIIVGGDNTFSFAENLLI